MACSSSIVFSVISNTRCWNQSNLEEELARRSTLVVCYAKEVDYKNEKLFSMERKLEENDKLLQEYIAGREEMQCLKEENKKLKYELDSQSVKEADNKSKYELQLRSIIAENEKLNSELESKKKEFMRRYVEMKKLKHKVESDTNEFELRLKTLEKQERVVAKDKLERMKNRAINAEEESMLLKKQLEEQYSRLNKCLHQKNEVEKKLLATNTLVKKLRQELKDAHKTIGGRASKAEKESMLLKEQLEELRRRLDECLHQKNDAEKKLSSFRTENNILVKQLREELRGYEYELQEARMKSASCENVQLVKEKGYREKAESELLKLSENQLSTKKLEDELASWKMMIKEIPGVSCADDMLLMFVALQREIAENTVKSGEAKAHLKLMEQQVGELERRLNECLHQKNDLERTFSSFRTDNNILVKQLREELRDYEYELQEARKLNSSFQGNLDLLKEKLSEEKNHRKRVESVKLSEIQLRTNGLEDELCSWKMAIQAIPGVSCAADIPVKFTALQKELAVVSEANTNLKQMEKQRETLGKILNEKEDVERKILCFRTESILVNQLPGKLNDHESEVHEHEEGNWKSSDVAILNAISDSEMVEMPIVEVKAHGMTIEETEDTSLIGMAEMVEVPIMEVKRMS